MTVYGLQMETTVQKYDEAMEKMEFSIALSSVWQLISRTNKYIDETEPWKLAKAEEKKDELASVMVHLADTLRRVAILLKPFLTQTPDKILRQLNVTADDLTSWESLVNFGSLPEGLAVVKKGEPIFPRLDMEEEISFIKEKMQGQSVTTVEKEPEEEQHLPEITIDDFKKIELRVAEVTACEPIKKANKLLKLQLDLGYETRQVV